MHIQRLRNIVTNPNLYASLNWSHTKCFNMVGTEWNARYQDMLSLLWNEIVVHHLIEKSHYSLFWWIAKVNWSLNISTFPSSNIMWSKISPNFSIRHAAAKRLWCCVNEQKKLKDNKIIFYHKIGKFKLAFSSQRAPLNRNHQKISRNLHELFSFVQLTLLDYEIWYLFSHETG